MQWPSIPELDRRRSESHDAPCGRQEPACCVVELRFVSLLQDVDKRLSNLLRIQTSNAVDGGMNQLPFGVQRRRPAAVVAEDAEDDSRGFLIAMIPAQQAQSPHGFFKFRRVSLGLDLAAPFVECLTAVNRLPIPHD